MKIERNFGGGIILLNLRAKKGNANQHTINKEKLFMLLVKLVIK